MGKSIKELNPDCEMCGGGQDVCYHSLMYPCPSKGKQRGKFYHECIMIGECPSCNLLRDAYSYAEEKGGRTNQYELSKKFRLGNSGAEKLCDRLEKHGIRIV